MNGPTLRVIADQNNDPKVKARNLWTTVYYPALLLAAKDGDYAEDLDFTTITGGDAATVIGHLEDIMEEADFSFAEEANIYTVSW